jgi:hypothetical protein
VVGRVPVLGSDHQVKVFHQLVGDRYDLIALPDLKGAAGAEVVLYVNTD